VGHTHWSFLGPQPSSRKFTGVDGPDFLPQIGQRIPPANAGTEGDTLRRTNAGKHPGQGAIPKGMSAKPNPYGAQLSIIRGAAVSRSGYDTIITAWLKRFHDMYG